MAREGLTPKIVTEAAASIVDAQGTAALTLTRLAADLGVATPSLYKHIGGLDDLMVRISTLAIRRLADDLTTAALGRSGRQALLSIAKVYRCFVTEHPGLYALTQAALRQDAALQQAEALRAVKVFEAVAKSYRVPDDLLVHAIRMLRAGLHGFVDIEARGGFQFSPSLDESFEFCVEALHTSLSRFGDIA